VQPGSIIEYKFRDQFDPNLYVSFQWTITSYLFTRVAKFSVKPDDSPSAPALMFRQYGLSANQNPQEQKDHSYLLEVHNLKGLTTNLICRRSTPCA
jgi:hypothetical protein